MAADSSKKLRGETERLRAENEQLRLRLEEAEQALEAIRTGQVESLIIEGPDGPRIFSLEGADHAYRVLVEAMNEGAATFSEDGTVFYCNARFAELLDASLERVIGSAIERFLPLQSRAAFKALVREANGGESRGELELLSESGQVVPAYLSVSVIRDDIGQRFCVVATDLRAQKRSEELIASERFARSVLEQAADAILVCDEKGRIIRASDSVRELCAKDPLLTRFEVALPLVLATTGDGGSQPSVGERAMRGEVLRAVHASLRRPDGSLAQLLVSAKGLYGPHKRTLGFVVTLVDVTGRMQAEERLRAALADAEEGRRTLQALMESVPEGITIADAKGIIRMVSRYGQVLLGGPHDQLTIEEVARRWTVFQSDGQTAMDPEDLPLTRAIRRGEVVQDFELVQVGSEGRYLHLLCDAAPIRDRDGLILGGVVAWRDISDRKEMESALRAANIRLADADRRKDQFLAVLSHELRNPLAPIKNGLYILDRAVPGGDQARRAQEIIDRQTGQLARLVNDLLDVTRITRNRIQLQRRRLELNELLRRTLEDYRSEFEKQEISLELIPADAPVYVNADWNRLAQVVGNLLQNAAKFTGRKGATRVRLEADAAARRAIVRVQDTGVGMTPQMISRLFQPFSQADDTLDRSKGGLGLGLALVKGLVELHGGEATARSEGLGRGSELAVSLPLDSPYPGQPEDSDLVVERGRRRVLIIEDNTDAAESLSTVLDLGGHEVAVAYTGPEGLAKARAFHPDVVLCDIGLPGMDGYEVAHALRSDEALKGIRLVALSGYALPEDLERAAKAGFERHIAKPVNLETLEQLFADVDGKAWRSDARVTEPPFP